MPALRYGAPAPLAGDVFVFSFVADPTDVALKAYLEISRRRTRPRKQEPELDVSGGKGAYRRLPCDAASVLDGVLPRRAPRRGCSVRRASSEDALSTARAERGCSFDGARRGGAVRMLMLVRRASRRFES